MNEEALARSSKINSLTANGATSGTASGLDSQAASGVTNLSGAQQNLVTAAATGAFDYSAYYNQPWMLNQQITTQQLANQQMTNQINNPLATNLSIPSSVPGILPSLQTVTDVTNNVYDPNMAAANLPVSMGSAAAALRNMSAAAIYQQTNPIDYSGAQNYTNQANLTNFGNDTQGQPQQQQQQQQQNPTTSSFDNSQYPIYRK